MIRWRVSYMHRMSISGWFFMLRMQSGVTLPLELVRDEVKE
jgi:hypothetical protein